MQCFLFCVCEWRITFFSYQFSVPLVFPLLIVFLLTINILILCHLQELESR